jgi:hypothetical protein
MRCDYQEPLKKHQCPDCLADARDCGCREADDTRLKLTFAQTTEAAVTFDTLRLADLNADQLEAVTTAAHAAICADLAIPGDTEFTVSVDGVEHVGQWFGEYHLGWDPVALAEDEV